MGLVNRHRIWQVVVDAGLVALAWYLAFYLRFDSGVPFIYDRFFERTILLVLGIQVATFVAFGFYNHWWRYVSIRDMWTVARGVVRRRAPLADRDLPGQSGLPVSACRAPSSSWTS